MYMERQIGQLVLRRTNQDTRQSAWNSWLQTRSLRIVSDSGVVVVVVVVVVVGPAGSDDEGGSEGSVDCGSEAGRAAASVMGVSGESLAGSGGAGAWRVERQIALRRGVSIDVGMGVVVSLNLPFSFQHRACLHYPKLPLVVVARAVMTL
jgi:hypothetical protein